MSQCLCACGCHRKVSRSTEARHLRGKGLRSLPASVLSQNKWLSSSQRRLTGEHRPRSDDQLADMEIDNMEFTSMDIKDLEIGGDQVDDNDDGWVDDNEGLADEAGIADDEDLYVEDTRMGTGHLGVRGGPSDDSRVAAIGGSNTAIGE